MQQLPENGFVRLRQIIGDPKRGTVGAFPVSRSAWWQGVKEGRYPQPVKISQRVSAWRVSDIQTLIDSFSKA